MTENQTNLKTHLIRRLSDGEFHSGQDLAESLGISRAAIWKSVQQLEQYGIRVDSVKGKGYRIRPALELLDAELIRAQMSARALARLYQIDVFPVLDSTNDYLKQRSQDPAALKQMEESGRRAWICLAEYQTNGRGRRGRQWVSSYASNICLSVLWRFDLAPMQLSGVSLVLGVAVAEALREFGIEEIALKWPNDLYWRKRKLGGLLFELAGEDSGPSTAITGLGLNIALDPAHANAIEQPWVDLREIQDMRPGMRNRLLALLISSMTECLQGFSENGLQDYVERWRQYDLCQDTQVTLIQGKQHIQGYARGIDDNGFLIVESGNGTQVYHSGEISLRVEQ